MMTDDLFPTVIVQTPRCFVCGKHGAIEVNTKGYDEWRAGKFIQEALPELDTDQRELLISGTHAHCWIEMMGGEEEG